MSFLNPIMLGALAAVSVPIIIHLLNRRKFQKVVWAAMRFLNISVEQNQRRMKVEDMILLALRCLLLALLALALARPALKSSTADVFGQSKVTAVILLDNSGSMGVSDGTLTRFEKAKKAAEQAIDAMPAGSATAVWLASDIVNEIIPLPTFDLNLARKTIREAPLTDRATDLLPAVNRAVDLQLSRTAIRKEIYLITDGQASGWKQISELRRLLDKAKKEVQTHLVFVGEHEGNNLGVSGLRLTSGLAPAKQPLRFEVKVSNYGKSEVRDVRASLSVDSEPPSDEFTIDTIPAGGTKSISMFAKLRAEGFHSVTARIPADRLPADDRRSVAVRAIKDVRVLLVDGEPSGEPRDSETFFLRHALVPVPQEVANDYFIKTSAITPADLSTARFDDFDAVVLANVGECSEAVVKSIEGYLRRGGGLVIFPGGRVNTSFYNEQLLKRFHFLPAALGRPRGQADQEEKYFTLQEKDYEHPIVSIWNDPGAGTLASARFFRAFELQPEKMEEGKTGKRENRNASNPVFPSSRLPAEKATDAGLPEIILRYADGAPAVMERTWGLGRVVLFSSTADTAWNDLPVRPSFVPLVHRTLGSIVQRQDEGLNVKVGEKFTRRASAELLGKDATFFKPRQTDAVRDLRRIEMSEGWPSLQYDQTDLAGVYDASVTDPPFALKFAAQPDPGESSLEELSAEQKNVFKGIANLVEWSPSVTLKGMVEQQRSGLEFWLPVMLAALAIAAVEMVLAQWFSRSK
jgi:hypothetical protein